MNPRRIARLAKAPARLLLLEPARRARRAWLAHRSLVPERLEGVLAKDGGLPVRDVRYRPWPSGAAREDWSGVRPTFERIFRSGREGLPQELARRFEERFASYTGARHVLLLPHGTDALRIALAAVLDTDGLEPGGEVIVPNLSFVASTTAALDRRLSVALVDVDPDTLLLDPERVAEAIVPGRTRAILPVHLFGQTADMVALRDVARRNGLAIVEDAAQAHGAIHELGRAGTLGDAAAFSFQSYKNLASGEGGALTTNDERVYERAWAMHNAGRARVGGERWLHDSLGWNVRPSEYVAAVLLQRLERLEEQQERRAERFAELRAELEDLESVKPLALAPGVVRHGVHMFVLRYVPAACGGLVQEDWVRALKAEGVPIQPLYNGLTQAQQPALQRIAAERPRFLRALPTPVADRAVREVLWLPHDLFLGDESDMRELAAAFRKVEQRYRPPVFALPDAPVPPEANGKPASNGRPHWSPSIERAEPLRVGLVGAGAMGALHADALGRSARFALAAVCDASLDAARRLAERHGCRAHASAAELVASEGIDLVLVAVPHPFHAEVAVPALERGLHVVCEKPLAVTAAAADAIVRAAQGAAGLFAVVLQNRLEPVYVEAQRLLASGELGAIRRASIVESAWRTSGYFASSPWRGTWSGEGGGVLVNQAPHVLDRYVWLCGAPERVLGLCDTNLHDIEVEDTASAILRHASGAHGYVHVSTTEAPAIAHTLVACDRGRIEIRDGRLFVTRLARSIDEAARDGAASAQLDGETREVHVARLGTIPAQLDAFWSNVAAAAAGEAALVAPGSEAVLSVELANAIALSSARRAEVTLPLERDGFERWIESKRAGATAPAQVGAAR